MEAAALSSDASAVEPPPARRPWAPTLNQVLVLALVILAIRVGLEPLVDNSFLTHLATGRLILDHGSIPRTDPYSWTAHGEPWTVQSWGASVIYAGLERSVGLVGVRIFIAALMVALVVLVWRLTAPAERLIGRFLAAMLAVVIGSALWSERPLLFGALFLALTMLIVEEEHDPRWLVPVMWMWVNTHGSFPFAVGLIGLLAVGRLLDDRALPSVELRALAWATGGTLLGVLNPLGWKLLVFPFDLLARREAFSSITEWKPPTWERPVEQIFAIQLALVVVLVLTRNRRWRTVLPMVVFAVLAVTSTRNLLQASLVFTPLLAGGLRGLGRIDGGQRAPLFRVAFVALAGLALAAAVVGIGGEDVDRSPYPLAASRWMRDQGLLGVNTRVVSRDFVGNYLEFEYGPDEVRTFMDDRVDMYPVRVIDDYVNLIRPGADYDAVLKAYGTTAVLWDWDSPLGRHLSTSPEWRVVRRDDTWLVAVPASG